MFKRDKSNSITNIEALRMNKIITKSLSGIGIIVKEVYFVGSRVRGNAHPKSDLDIIVIPKYKLWDNALEYTKLMDKVITKIRNIKYKGNNIELQIHTYFNEIESGFNYIKITSEGLKKVVEGI